MSSFDLQKSFSLKVIIGEHYKYLVKVLVFGPGNKRVEPQHANAGILIFSEQKGLYTVRLDLNGEVKDTIVALDKDITCRIDRRVSSWDDEVLIQPPAQYSAAMLYLEENEELDEYRDTAIRQSRSSTDRSIQTNDSGSLFIFLRYGSKKRLVQAAESSPKSDITSFHVIDGTGATVASLKNSNQIFIDRERGMVAYNAYLKHGTYYLVYDGTEPRQMPIYVYQHWHTQLFMLMDTEPLFATTRVFISQERSFNPDSILNRYIDILSNKLQNQDYKLDSELIRMSAEGKFISPILGIICAYIYFKGDNRQDDDLFRVIMKNLKERIFRDDPESADMRALDILATKHYPDHKYKKTAVSGTPMIRLGFDTIRAASQTSIRLIKQKSLNDLISEGQFSDSPFNTFSPVEFPSFPEQSLGKRLPTIKVNLGNRYLGTKQQPYISSLEDSDILSINFPDIEQVMDGIEDSKVKRISLSPRDYFKSDIIKRIHPKRIQNKRQELPLSELYKSNILEYIKGGPIQESDSWVKISISDLVRADDKLSINDISSQLNLSGNTVSRILGEFKQEAGKTSKKTI